MPSSFPEALPYGDYLRTGAIAKFSPVMESVRKFAAGGGLVLGICNGFQILCESGLLPGRSDAQRRPQVRLQAGAGAGGKCRDSLHQCLYDREKCLTIPIGHMEGNYFCDPATLGRVAARQSHRVPLFLARRAKSQPRPIPTDRWTTLPESAAPAATSLGMMPHPERSAEPELGCTDGVKVFQSMVGAMAAR